VVFGCEDVSTHWIQRPLDVRHMVLASSLVKT
jgi:hypothetical protein